MAFPPLSPACSWQRLGEPAAGTAGFPSAGLQGPRTATVFALEIHMANTHALFPKAISYIYKIIKIRDLEVSWSKVWFAIVLELL